MQAKLYYCACIYSAIEVLHENAVLHRFINPNSVYISDKSIPILTDMLLCKQMDGGKSFKICGDPNYFAPEIPSNQGYDFAADLWAYGMLVYEMFEGASLFASTSDDTKLFQILTNFKESDVRFTDKTPSLARELITAMLKPNPADRLGYTKASMVRELACFEGKPFVHDL